MTLRKKFLTLAISLLVCTLFIACSNLKSDTEISVKGSKEEIQESSTENNVDEEQFTDPVLKDYILENYDTDLDGYISKEEADAVIEISIQGEYLGEKSELRSLKGVEIFQNLESLCFNCAQVEDIDVSQNTKLKSLIGMENKIKTIDLSQNNELEILNLENNELDSIDLSKNDKLTNIVLNGNNLTTLDLSKNTLLESVQLQNNKLETVFFEEMESLQWLNLDGNCLSNIVFILCVDNTGISDFGKVRV